MIHTETVRKYLASANDYPQLRRVAHEVNKSELTLPREKWRTLAQLRARKCPLLRQYLHSIGAEDSPNYLLCVEAEHNTVHLFHCGRVQTELTPKTCGGDQQKWQHWWWWMSGSESWEN